MVLEPVEAVNDWKWLDDLRREFGGFDDDFIAAVNEEVPMPPDNPELDEFFR